MAGQVYFNYRRSFGTDDAQHIFVQLELFFSRERLLLDLGGQSGRSNWISELKDFGDGGDVMLVLIPAGWEEVFSDPAQKATRMQVEREVALAVSRNVHLLPILVNRDDTPDFATLPRPLNRMADIEPARFRRGRDFRDGEELAGRVYRMMPARQPLVWWKLAAAACAVFMLGAVWGGATGGARSMAATAPPAEFVRLNNEIEQLRASVAAREARTLELERELAEMRTRLAHGGASAPIPVAAAPAIAPPPIAPDAAPSIEPLGTAVSAVDVISADAPSPTPPPEPDLSQNAGVVVTADENSQLSLPVSAPDSALARRAPLARFSDCADCPAMRVLPAGSFVMGSDDGEADEGPARLTEVASFAMAETEVTVGQYERFVAETGWRPTDACATFEAGRWAKRAGRSWRRPGFEQADTHPVVCVTYADATAYAEWLSAKTGQVYRLPTEAEWEYAARSGAAQRYAFGDNRAAAREAAWFSATSRRSTHPVASMSASEWGLRHMSGNAWEWSAGCWRSRLDREPRGDDCAAASLRGGAWSTGLQRLRVSERFRFSRETRSSAVGFRIAREL